MNNRSVNFYLTVVFSVGFILKFTGILSISWTEIFSYAAMLWGINIFYISFLKNQPAGVFIGALLFQIGILLFLNSKFELSDPKRIFIPALMSIIGFSLLLTNLLEHSNKYRLLLSILISLIGVLLVIFRGQFDAEMFFYSFLGIVKDFWLILIILIATILLSVREFNREKKNDG